MSTEQPCYNRNGETLWLLFTLSLVKDEKDDPAYFILQIQNNSLLKIAEERLKSTSYHDPLTALPNRNKFEQELHHFVAISQRHDQKFAVIFIDLDRFRNVSETLGWEAGNSLLQVTAQRITKAVRNTDLVAKLEDDEFAILIPDIKREDSCSDSR